MSARDNSPYDKLMRGDYSAFLDSRDGQLDLAIEEINDAIAPYTREGLLVQQPPIGSVVTEEAFSNFDPSTIPQQGVPLPTPDQVASGTPQAIYAPGDYGDRIVLPITFLGGDVQLVLQRPRGTRISLIIQNTLPQLVTNNIIVSYGVPAAPGIGLQIPPGGNIFEDKAVPQNDVYIFAPAAGIVLVAFINAVPEQPQTRRN